MTKKIIIIIILILAINILISFRKEPKTEPVFAEEENNNEHSIYNLSFEDIYVTTKNLYNYFYKTNIKILGIYPRMNYLYQKGLANKIRYYPFKKVMINPNILEFEKHFKNILKNYGLNKEIEKIEFNGVAISKIKIYGSKKEVNKLLKDYPKMKLE